MGINESAALGRLENFTHFLERVMLERNVNYTSLWLVFQNKSTGINITGGNFLGNNITVSLNTSTVSRDLVIINGSVNSTDISGTGTLFNLTIAFASQSKTVELTRDKSGLYAFFRLERGENLINGHVVG
jgi:hypothetical protein